MLSDVLALTREVAGTVRIGIIGTTARWLVPQLLRTAPQRYPHLHLVFVELTTTRLDAQLATGEVDLAVLNLPAKGTDLALDPTFRRGSRPGRARRPPSGRLGEVSIRALKGMPLLLPVAGTAFRADLDAVLNLTDTTLARARRDRRNSPHRLADLRGLGPLHPAGDRRAELPAWQLRARQTHRDSPPAHRGRPAGDGTALGAGAGRARPADRDRLRSLQDPRGAFPGPSRFPAPSQCRCPRTRRRPAIGAAREALATSATAGPSCQAHSPRR